MKLDLGDLLLQGPRKFYSQNLCGSHDSPAFISSVRGFNLLARHVYLTFFFFLVSFLFRELPATINSIQSESLSSIHPNRRNSIQPRPMFSRSCREPSGMSWWRPGFLFVLFRSQFNSSFTASSKSSFSGQTPSRFICFSRRDALCFTSTGPRFLCFLISASYIVYLRHLLAAATSHQARRGKK